MCIRDSKKRDLQKFVAELDVAGDVWSNDGNMGVVQRAAESLRRYRVIDLQRTYSALAVDRVAIHLSMSTSSTIQLLQTMIRDGHLSASLSPHQPQQNGTTNGTTITSSTATSTPILRFLASQTPSNDDASIDSAIQSRLKKIEALSTFVKEADRRLAVSKEYVDWVRRNKSADGGTAAFEDPMDTAWDGGEDEDIMAG